MSVFFCGRKANLVQIFLLNWSFLLVHRNKVSVTVYLFLALYGSTTIQSRSFLKNIENFVWFLKQYLLGFLILEKQLTNIPDRGFLFLCNTLLLYSLTDRGFLFLRNTLLLYSLSPYSQTESQTEKPIHLIRVGWRNLFPVVLLCQFSVLAGNRFCFYTLLVYLEYHTVVV